MVDYAKNYEASIRILAEILIHRKPASTSDGYLLEKTALYWYASGRRDDLIENPDVTLEDYNEVLKIDVERIFQKVLDEAASARKAEAANNLEYCRGGFTHTPDTERLYIDTDGIKYTGHKEEV